MVVERATYRPARERSFTPLVVERHENFAHFVVQVQQRLDAVAVVLQIAEQ